MKKPIKYSAVLLLSVCSSVMTGCMKEDLDNMRKDFQELEEQVNSDAVTLTFNDMDEITGEDKSKPVDIKVIGTLPADEVKVASYYPFIEFFKFAEIGTLEVSIPELTMIWPYTFDGSSNFKVFKSDYVTVLGDGLTGGMFWKSSVEEVDLPNLTLLTQMEFSNCKKLRSVNFPNVKEVNGSQVFFECVSLERLDLPNLTTFTQLNLANFARSCHNLKEVNMPKVTSLPGSAFMDCYSLVQIDLPEVTELGQDVFWNCKSLSKVSLPKLKELPQRTFAGCIAFDFDANSYP